ncbi:MAG: hypothetical protein MI974_33190 [Chitinophagales bacterium]|nr:hypothetical protein [Chitinophagales bacterium]
MLYKILVPKYWEDRQTLLWKIALQNQELEHVTDYCSAAEEYYASAFFASTAEDYDHVDWGKTMLINQLDYAKKIASGHPEARILGVIKAPTKQEIQVDNELLGFDILDKPGHYSCLTNLNSIPALKAYHLKINQYALLNDIDTAYQLKEWLRKNRGPIDWHDRHCEVWAVFRV